MEMITSITQLVGNTPLLHLGNFEKINALPAAILAKLESQNPSGSVKARAALFMLETAEKKGHITPGATIIEPTSGNTGIALAAIGAARGYKVILTMPETMSIERQKLLKAYGAAVILTAGKLGMQGAQDKAREIAAQTPNSFIPGQFENPANPQAHIETTGPEIWRQAGGKLDIFVAGVGTGGTVTGVGTFLKEKNPQIKVVAVEPQNSPLLSKGTAGKHNLQGIGANFVPEILNRSVYDEVIPVLEEDAYQAGRSLAGDGLLVGISGGAALYAAKQLALRPENKGKTIVVILPDSGERYLSTAMYED